MYMGESSSEGNTMSASGDLIMEMTALLKSTDVRESSEKDSACIFRIAHPLLTRKPDAYTPQVISIGPFHHKKLDHYKETDSYKDKIMNQYSPFLLVQSIKNMNAEIRAFYDRDIPYGDDDLSSMLALDASFLLQFLLSIHNIYSYKKLKQGNQILQLKKKTPLWCAIQSDIFLLENQVPLFLLSHVINQHAVPDYQISEHDRIELKQILQVACSVFNPFSPGQVITERVPDIRKTRHILEYLHHFINPDTSAEGDIEGVRPWILRFLFEEITATGGSLPSATELYGAGVKFKPCSSGNMSEIHFDRKRSTLFMPVIIINDFTEAVLRNLVALELYLYTKEKPIAGYTYLMDRLIDTPQDVAVLKRSGVLKSQIGSDKEVAEMWNSLCKSIPENSFEPVNLALEEAEKYYRSKWRVLLAEYKQVHCSKPWVILSVIAAVMLFILTFMQVFCAFYTCNKSSNAH